MQVGPYVLALVDDSARIQHQGVVHAVKEPELRAALSELEIRNALDIYHVQVAKLAEPGEHKAARIVVFCILCFVNVVHDLVWCHLQASKWLAKNNACA